MGSKGDLEQIRNGSLAQSNKKILENISIRNLLLQGETEGPVGFNQVTITFPFSSLWIIQTKNVGISLCEIPFTFYLSFVLIAFNVPPLPILFL